MKTRLLALIVGTVFFCLANSAPSFAVSYFYTGLPYTIFNYSPLDPNLGTSMTGTLTFDYTTPPPDGVYSLSNPHIAGVSLQSGIHNLDQSFLYVPYDNHVTISNGQIVDWLIYLAQITDVCCNDTRHAGFVLGIGVPDLSGGDVSAEIFLYPASHDGHNLQQGTWSGPTPLPAALPLFASGLGALGLLGWRRKRKNAAAIAAA